MTKIEWTNETNNPFVGCTKISEGCKNCYALPMAVRNAHNHKLPDEIREAYFSVISKIDGKWNWNGKIAFIESAIYKILGWNKSRMVFLCSMGDIFHENNSFDKINEVFNAIAISQEHTFQILTKRPERMLEYFTGNYYNKQKLFLHSIDSTLIGWPLNNLWLGVTAENQEQANKRIPILLQIPAAVRFVSVEPMLGPIDFYEITYGNQFHNVLNGVLDITTSQLGILGDKLDWVICGGESGHKARPMNPEWVKSLRDQCKKAKVPFFFKQWGEYLPISRKEVEKYPLSKLLGIAEHRMVYVKVGKKQAGRLLNGKEYKEMPKAKS
jgi:protein gp37